MGKVMYNGIPSGGSSDNSYLVKHKDTNVGTELDALNESLTTLDSNVGDATKITSEQYQSISDLLEYYIDNGYLPDVNKQELVPIMTSNTAPYGEAFSSGIQYDNQPYRAFDKSESTLWVSPSSASNWLAYDFTKEVEVKKAYITMQYGTVPTYSVKVQYSDDKSNWKETGGIVQGLTNADYFATIHVPSVGKHRYWRILMNHSSATNSNIHTLQFYGIK